MVGLGSDQGEKWPKPEPEGDLASESELKNGPNPGGKGVLGRELKSIIFGRRSALSIFSVDIYTSSPIAEYENAL